jgi:hypothetical protein
MERGVKVLIKDHNKNLITCLKAENALECLPLETAEGHVPDKLMKMLIKESPPAICRIIVGTGFPIFNL